MSDPLYLRQRAQPDWGGAGTSENGRARARISQIGCALLFRRATFRRTLITTKRKKIRVFWKVESRSSSIC